MGFMEMRFSNKKSMQYEPSLLQDQELVKSFGKELFKGGVVSDDSSIAVNSINAPRTLDSKIIYSPYFITPDMSLSFNGDILAVSERLNWLIQFNNAIMIRLPEHIFDVGFQYKVISELKLLRNIKFRMAYLNKNFQREEFIDIDQLFNIEDVTYRARDNQVLINREIIKIFKILERDVMPQVKVGVHCIRPNKCEFYNFCWSKISIGNIHNISGLTSKQVRYLEDNGITNIQNLPDNFKLSKRTLSEIKAVFRNKPILKRANIQKWFDTIDSNDAISYLNIETFESAIPLYKNCKPYEVLPYQYCLLIRNNDSKQFRESSFMAKSTHDPRYQFIKSLISDINSVGPIVVYKYKMTVTILSNISIVYPEFKNEIDNIIRRCWDLSEPIKSGWYFHHSLTKNKNLKAVFLSLDNNNLYSNLKISDSEKASSYYRLIAELPIRKGGQVISELKEFCYTETLAIIKVFEIFNSM
jgi:hypothetical protein